MTGVSIADCLARGAELKGVSDTWRLDTELLLAEALGAGRALLIAHPQRELSSPQLQKFDDYLARRRRGEPIAYILGRREFWSLELSVNEAVLVPRPETELLVEAALAALAGFSDQSVRIADMGTGSGAIALAIASERADASVVAVDSSAAALAVARHNAVQLGIGNVSFVLSHWFDALGDTNFDMVVSNPPYVANDDPHLARGDLRFEPRQALVSGEDGLSDIRLLADQGRQFLRPGGKLLLEHGWQQGEAVRRILEERGYQAVRTLPDLAGLDRVTMACNGERSAGHS